MKRFIVVFIALSGICFSQLGNNNMYLLKNLDTHRIPSQFNVPWHFAACWGYVAPNGREYAIMGCGMGTMIVDITDSANISERYFRPAAINLSNPDPGNIWREMKVYSHYLYVVSEADTSELEIFDLQYLPDSVRYVGRYHVPGHSSTHSISQSGPYLYLNGANSSFGQGVTILDLTNPEAPVKRGAWNVEYVHDSRTVNDTLFTSNINTGHLTMFDVSNKDTVRFITRFPTLHNPATHNSAVTRDRKYILTTDETSSPAGKLKIWNIENIFNVVFVTNWQPTGITNTIVHNVEIYGDTAVIAHYQAGVRVLNISNPTMPVEIAWYDTYPTANTNQFAGCWGVFKFPSGKIIASDMNRGLFVLKMGTPFGIIPISGEVPLTFALSQNYPNPFNPSTKIRFSIPRSEFVKITIYDAIGKEVHTLVNQQLKGGIYEADFDAANMPSGVYFYNLIAGDFIETRKMVLVK